MFIVFSSSESIRRSYSQMRKIFKNMLIFSPVLTFNTQAFKHKKKNNKTKKNLVKRYAVVDTRLFKKSRLKKEKKKGNNSEY
jgi:hypothetical protein